jgi:hypothetical protein
VARSIGSGPTLELDDPSQLRQPLQVTIAAKSRCQPGEITHGRDKRLHPVAEVLLGRGTAQVDEPDRSTFRRSYNPQQASGRLKRDHAVFAERRFGQLRGPVVDGLCIEFLVGRGSPGGTNRTQLEHPCAAPLGWLAPRKRERSGEEGNRGALPRSRRGARCCARGLGPTEAETSLSYHSNRAARRAALSGASDLPAQLDSNRGLFHKGLLGRASRNLERRAA